MRRVVAVSDEDYQLEIAFPEKPVFVEAVTDLYLLWTEVTKNEVGLEHKYEAWRGALILRWGNPISKASAFNIFEAVVTQVLALKKTISGSHSLISSESQPLESLQSSLPSVTPTCPA
jgi:hypothetical protein